VWEREERLKSFERSLWFEKERMREGGGKLKKGGKIVRKKEDGKKRKNFNFCF
jgi:hypothetical protein